ncbi:MAG TPA: hypothetical protein VE977_03345 [Pyrinomonadaceae bacterium]|jgi:ElaB/YqjD/DUF883 family membrane-anchored ribosome-binding protein|nr:hypothetical protein [Pyrinomonadaceae bacterium]
MSQNTTSTDFPGTSQSGSQSGSATGTASALAQEYGGKISDAASQAKDFVSDKISVVGDKIKDLQNADFAEMAENAKDYTRKNPGQALLISAAAGLLVGLILRGRR